MTALLADDLLRYVARIPGAQERDQIASLLGAADRYVLDDAVAQAVSDTVLLEPSSVEHNLDFVGLPASITWIEYADAARRTIDEAGILLPGSHAPDRVGALLCCFPEDEERILTVVAWRFPGGGVHHAQAMMFWDTRRLVDLSGMARERYSRERDECWERIAMQINTFIPSGFETEIEVLRPDGSAEETARIKEEAHRDASSEGLFLLGVLLMLQTRDVALVEEADGVRRVTLTPRPMPWWRSGRGFVRTESGPHALLSWVPVDRPSLRDRLVLRLRSVIRLRS